MAPQIEAVEKGIDIDFVCKDIDELIGECREGTVRIKKFVDDRKHFAHPGQDKVQDTDINRELESTLHQKTPGRHSRGKLRRRRNHIHRQSAGGTIAGSWPQPWLIGVLQ
jgi:hypothetical protein